MSAISALKQQTEALAAQAATMNLRTMSKEEKAAFLDSIDKVQRLVAEELEKIVNESELLSYSEERKNYFANLCNYEQKKAFEEKAQKLQEDRNPLNVLASALNTIRFPYGSTVLMVTSRLRILKEVRVDNTATVKDLKVAAAPALGVPLESITGVVIGMKMFHDDEEFLAATKGAEQIYIAF